MRTLASLLLAVVASLSLTAHAAPAAAVPAPPEPVVQAQVVRIGLNTANTETLQRELAGIGLTKAQAIVAHREANGSFKSVDELLEVNGIGKSLLDRNQDRLMID